MKQKNLELFNLAQRYKNRRCMRYGGRTIYDCRAIAGEAKRSLKLNISPATLSRFLFRAKRYIRRGLRKGQYLKGKYLGKRIYEQTNRIFGSVNTYNSLAEEVRRLVLAGENPKAHKRRLCRDYHLPVAIIEDEWTSAQENIKRFSPQEIKLLRQLECPTITDLYD